MKHQPRVRTCWAIVPPKCTPATLLLLLLRYRDRQVRVLPAIPAAEERGGVLDSVSIHVQHRTGACVLRLSGTIGDQEFLLRQVFPTLGQIAERNVDGSANV